MKKCILFCGIAAMMAGVFTGCGDKASSNASDNAFADSLAVYTGTVCGAQVSNELATFPADELGKINKEDVVAGVKEALFADTAKQGYNIGLSVGVNLARAVQFYSKACDIDRKALFEAFKEAFMADSFPNLREATANYRNLEMKAQQMVQDKINEQKAQAPEAIQNVKTGEAFVNNLKKEDASIKTTESGLSYKVIAEGEGEEITADDVVMVKYVFKDVAGKVLQETGDSPARLSVSGTVPGFSEGLKLLKKGAKASLYIPGELGYGVDGIPQLGVGPNAMLVYDIEIVDVIKK